MVFVPCVKHRTAALKCKHTYMPTSSILHPGSTCQGIDGCTGRSQSSSCGPFLCCFSSGTTLTPAASPRVKIPGMHSWMGLLGLHGAWLCHRHLLLHSLPFTHVNTGGISLAGNPSFCATIEDNKNLQELGRQRSFFLYSSSAALFKPQM